MYNNILKYHQYVELIRYRDRDQIDDLVRRYSPSTKISNININIDEFLDKLYTYEDLQSKKTGHSDHTIYLIGMKIMLPREMSKTHDASFVKFILENLGWDKYPYYTITYKVKSCRYLEILMTERFFYETPVLKEVILNSDVWMIPGKGRVKAGTEGAIKVRSRGEILRMETTHFSTKDDHLCFSHIRFMQWREKILGLCRQFFNENSCEPETKVVLTKVNYSGWYGQEKYNARRLNSAIASVENVLTNVYEMYSGSGYSEITDPEGYQKLQTLLKTYNTILHNPEKLNRIIPKNNRYDTVDFSFNQSTKKFRSQVDKLRRYLTREINRFVRDVMSLVISDMKQIGLSPGYGFTV